VKWELGELTPDLGGFALTAINKSPKVVCARPFKIQYGGAA
jgi:hypothetical protein